MTDQVEPSLLVVQHEELCGLGMFGPWLAQSAVALDVRRPYAGDDLPATLADHDGLLVMGGTMSANDDADVPWLAQVKELFRDAAERATPALGICLGHQLAAVALGGEVGRNPRGQQLGLTEIGWLPDAGDDPLVGRLGRPSPGVQWNNDIVLEPPPGLVALARTPAGELQAARLAPTVWGVQLHPEADERVVGPWADEDRSHHPDGVVDQVVAAIAAGHDGLERSWRPLAESLATLVREHVHVSRP